MNTIEYAYIYKVCYLINKTSKGYRDVYYYSDVEHTKKFFSMTEFAYGLIRIEYIRVFNFSREYDMAIATSKRINDGEPDNNFYNPME